jgi:hypothetical protein
VPGPQPCCTPHPWEFFLWDHPGCGHGDCHGGCGHEGTPHMVLEGEHLPAGHDDLIVPYGGPR